MPSDDANFEAVDLPGLEFSLLFSHSIILYITNSYICSSGNPRAAKKKSFGDHAEINTEFKNYVYGK